MIKYTQRIKDFLVEHVGAELDGENARIQHCFFSKKELVALMSVERSDIPLVLATMYAESTSTDYRVFVDGTVSCAGRSAYASTMRRLLEKRLEVGI